MAELPGVGLITGAASGIGHATALAFAEAGCRRLTLVDMNEQGLEATTLLLLKARPDNNLNIEVGSTTDQEFTQRMVHSTIYRWSRLDYAVNCAGVLGPPAPSHEVDLDEHDRVMNVNYRGTFLSGRAELGAMLLNEVDTSNSQRGAVVNIASTWGLVGAKGFSAYCASKGAIISMTRADALDYSQHGIRVNCICPGLINTPLATLNNSPEVIEALEPVVNEMTPMKRMGEPREIADAAVFLCSQRASFIQGHTLVVDGGLTVH